MAILETKLCLQTLPLNLIAIKVIDSSYAEGKASLVLALSVVIKNAGVDGLLI
jgi:hypothetical protein